ACARRSRRRSAASAPTTITRDAIHFQDERMAVSNARVARVEAEAVEPGYEWVALSVTTLGAFLASLQGSALLIALPDILVKLQASFLTLMWVLLGYLLITTALVPVIGRLADMVGRKHLYNAGFAVFTVGSLLAGLSQPQFHGGDLV